MINRGSEWRRWELHLHTPGTKKSDQYRGQNEKEKWDYFYSTISEYVGDGTNPLKTICAIAVTDYLSIDNYFRIRNENRLPDCIKFVFPNVELRMMPAAQKSPINIHCIFNPKITDDLESRFFAKLQFSYKDSSYGATRAELIRLGRDFCGDSTISKDIAYSKGLNQYVISFDTLKKIFKADPSLREDTLIVVSNKSNDGVSGLCALHSDYFQGDVSQLEATRRAIYQFADMVYSSNKKDIDYFLGEGKDDPELVKKKCGSLMPCIHGSDAHCNARVFSPEGNKFCWIKADLTFEGLKQILYEPKERVRICSNFPDSKPSYYVIDRVEIENSDEFSPDPIYMSDKLTCIIGGKSTGKSLLLHNMAMALDRKQVLEKIKIAKTNVREIPGLKVFWKDGACSDNNSVRRKIVYIPQTYLNKLSDEEQVTTEIDDIIRDIILQDDSCNVAYDQMNSKIVILKQNVTKAIFDFIQILRDKEALVNECREIGDSESISAEIEKLTSQFNLLSEKVNITEEDIMHYQKSVENRRSLEKELSSLIKEISMIKNILSVVEEKSLNQFSFNFLEVSVREGILLAKQGADTIWVEQREKIVTSAKERSVVVQQKLEDENKTINLLQSQIDGNERIKFISNKIMKERERLGRLKEKLSDLEKLEVRYRETLTALSNVFDNFSKIYHEYIDSINNNVDIQLTDLRFSAERVFQLDKFRAKVVEIINNRTFKRFTPFELQDVVENNLSSGNLWLLIESLTTNTSETLQFKTAYSIESGLRELLTDWYNVNYVVEMDKDKIKDMSPGKKALVLLRLLISLAESKCPILIDQPEDDLDNRSIFGELIEFIRAKKIDRQIILVTHNANIVLGGDAEMVIVANQDGSNSANCQYRFEYRCGSIEDNTPLFDENNQMLRGILNQKGMQEHICEILEGGEKAFDMRRHKYHFISSL